MIIAYELNDQYFYILGLIDAASLITPPLAYVNNASGTIKIKDQTGNLQVIGAAGATSLNLAYIGGSNGNYNALITSVFNPQFGTDYVAIVDVTTPGGGVGHWELPVKITQRKN